MIDDRSDHHGLYFCARRFTLVLMTSRFARYMTDGTNVALSYGDWQGASKSMRFADSESSPRTPPPSTAIPAFNVAAPSAT